MQLVTNVDVDEKNISEWNVLLAPSKEPFNKAAFRLKITFPLEYPFKPPSIVFAKPIYHPNVEENGRTCFPAINPNSWKASTSVQEILEELNNMLANPDVKYALRSDAAKTYTENRDLYFQKVAESIKAAGEKRPQNDFT